MKQRLGYFPAALAAAILMMSAEAARAQVTPAEGYLPPMTLRLSRSASRSSPTIPIPTGAQTIVDADGNEINPAAFDVKRAYINVTGNINHLIAFRITPDITRESGVGGEHRRKASPFVSSTPTASSIWTMPGPPKVPGPGWASSRRPTSTIWKSIYRYRFQGPIFTDAEKYLTSSDFGLSTHYNFAGNYGDVQRRVLQRQRVLQRGGQ